MDGRRLNGKKFRWVWPVLWLVIGILVGCRGEGPVDGVTETAVPTQTLEREEANAEVPVATRAPTEEAVQRVDAEKVRATVIPADAEGGEIKLRAPGSKDDPIAVARNALGKRLGVGVPAIELVRAMADEYPIDHLGCPDGKEERAVAEGIVTGTTVVLRVEGVRYIYHVRGKVAVFCGEEAD